MKNFFTKRNLLLLALSLILPLLILILHPLGLDANQCVLLASLVLVIFWWVANLIPKWISSLLLLAVFSLFGKTPLTSVFQFPLSDNFIVILFAFLFSQGIANSGLTKRLLQPLFYRWIHTPIQFLLFVMLCNIGLIFVIPQPFARIILFAFIVNEFLQDVCPDNRPRDILMFSVFLFSMTSNMLFMRGDIIMNNAVQSFGSVAFTESSWATAMALPTLLLMLAELVLLLLIYKKTLKDLHFSSPSSPPSKNSLEKKDWVTLSLIGITVLLMATESLHGIPSKWIILVSTILMFFIKLLRFQDIRSINFNLLIWLTAAFSIGNVMRSSGVADILFSRLSTLFPSDFNISFLLAVIFVTMALHMLLGSSVTTTSVVIPGIVSISTGRASDAMLVLIIYILVYNHFLLPLHNAILVIGNGDGHFSNKTVMQFGTALTGLVPLFVLFVYQSWWQLIGLF